jgi:AcrR family transcriptional regulator
VKNEALSRHRGQPAEDAFDRLLAAARELFATDGFGATSLDAVAAAAGVTKGSLYHHFAGKTDLFEAVFEEEARALSERVAATVAAEPDAWKGAYAGVRAFLEGSQAAAVRRIMLLDGPSVLGWERVREIESEYGLALIKLAIGRLAASGEIARHDVTTLAHLLFGALSEGALLIASAGDPARARRKVEREVRLLLDGLAAGRRGQ